MRVLIEENWDVLINKRKKIGLCTLIKTGTENGGTSQLAILHRKNAYFYKTANGARVGDMFMSLIHTCELNAVNPFHYLTELQQHAAAVAQCPDNWLLWNYQQALSQEPTTSEA